MENITYQVGGSLSVNAPTYVKRSADIQLYNALKQGEFCYVLNARQMGKSSLLVQTQYQLQGEGRVCASVDMTAIGSENVTPLQWYKGIIAQLWRGFDLLEEFNLKSWWKEEEDFSFLQRLNRFVADVLLKLFPHEKIVIFVDEIDSILGLSFPVDDLFAWIRYCYNQRAMNPEYNRLTFAIFGVATPSDLIQDKTRTPFNIGTAIDLTGFNLQEATPLLKGLQLKTGNPQGVLKEILRWTGGQPFLTQKLCQLVLTSSQEAVEGEMAVPPGMEQFWVESLVQAKMIYKWEGQDEPEHFRTIRDRILAKNQLTPRVLGIYQQLLQRNPIETDDSREQTELVLSGLVVKNQGYLQIKNPIYAGIFNRDWVEKQLNVLRPYSQNLNAWLESGQNDESRLLQGQALQEAKQWSIGKSLSNLDYQYLAKSEERDRSLNQQALELEKAKALAKTATLQRRLLSVISLGFVIASILGLTAFWQFRQASEKEQRARLSEINALISSSDGQFASNQKLDALVSAIKAKRRLETLKKTNPQTEKNVQRVLQQGIYWIHEKNRLTGYEGSVLGVDYSADGQLIVTVGADRTIKLWKPDGTLVKTLSAKNHGTIYSVEFYPDPSHPLLVTTDLEGTVNLWNYETEKIQVTFEKQQGVVWDASFSPNGQWIATSHANNVIKLWTKDGKLQHTLKGHRKMVSETAFLPDNQTLVSVSADGTMKFWNTDGTLLQNIAESLHDYWSVTVQPQGKLIATGEWDHKIHLWKPDGTLFNTLEGHTGGVMQLDFAPDGQILASASQDATVRLWRLDGSLYGLFLAHSAVVRDIAISQTQNWQVASSSDDNTVRLWQPRSPLIKEIHWNTKVWDIAFLPETDQFLIENVDNHVAFVDTQGKTQQTIPTESVLGFTVSPKSQQVAVGETNNNISLWTSKGKLLNTFKGHQAQVWDVAFSPDEQFLVSVSDDSTVKLWRKDGTLVKSLEDHEGRVHRVVFNSKNGHFATTGADGTIKIWNLSGELLHSINAHDSDIFGLAASQDGKYIASAGMDNLVKIWRWDGTLVKTLQGHNNGVPTVDFSPDGKMLASGSLDRTVKLWTIEGEEIKTLYGFGGAIWALRFSPDGKQLVTGSDDKIVAVWNIPEVLKVDEFAYACDWVGDYLRTNSEVSPQDRKLCQD